MKEMYSAIKSQQILQPASHLATLERASMSSLSPGPHHSLLRNRSQQRNDRVANMKRGSMRGIQTLFAQGPYGSTNSMDGRLSPAPSFATSANEVRVFKDYLVKQALILLLSAFRV